MAAATEKFAIMRWLNDQNKVSVLSTKYILTPEKSEYFPADTGISRFPGSRKHWNFRILAVGDETDMNLWLNKNEAYLRLNQNDKFSDETPKKLLLTEDVQASTPFSTTAVKSSKLETPKKMTEVTEHTPRKTSTLSKSEQYLQDQETPRRKRIRKLEEEVKNLKDDMRRYSKKCRRLEDKIHVDQGKKDLKKTEIPEKTDEAPEIIKKETELMQSKTYTDEAECVDDTVLKQSAKTGPVKNFQELCNQIFSEHELKFCSPTGKRTVKCGDKGARPPLDRAKLKQLFASAEQQLKFDKAMAHKKLENYQKVLRRK